MKKTLCAVTIYLACFCTLVYAQTWTQTSDADFSAGEFNYTEIQGTGANAGLQLQSSTPAQFGCEFRIDGSSNFKLDNLYGYSIRFTAVNTQACSTLHICTYGANLTTSTYYAIGLQADDGTGKPSGTWMGATNNGYLIMSYDGVTLGWQPIPLNESVNLAAGTVYHLVVKYSSGGVGPFVYLGVYGTTPQLPITSDGKTNASITQLQSLDNGATWTDRTAQPMYVVQGNVAAEGSVYYTHNSVVGEIYGTRLYGERITVTGGTKILRSVSFKVRATTSSLPPTDDLYAVLAKADGTVIETIKLLDKNVVTTTMDWYTANFSQPRILDNGQSYRIYLKSPSSTALCSYQPEVVEGYPTAYPLADGLTYGGTNSVYAENTGAGWVESTDKDVVFKLFSSTYPSGNFVSSAFDAGSPAIFHTIKWTADQPANTSLKIQLASSDSDSGPWTFTGSDGTETSYYTESAGETVNGQHNGKRYLKYKVFLSTADTSKTPVLESFTLDYSARPMPGTKLQTICAPNPYDPTQGRMAIDYLLSKPSQVVVKIYTLTGDLVRKMEFAAGQNGGKGESNRVEWDGRNSAGMQAANGVYIVNIVVEPGDGTDKIKENKKVLLIK